MKVFATVSTELIERLISCPPQHMAVGNEYKLATFAVTNEESMMPSKLKIRDRERPVAGEVYRVIFSRQKREKFIDAKSGKQCECRDNLLVRVYPHDKGEVEAPHELRFFTCPLTSEPIISPAPVYMEKIDGVKERGVWWIAAPETEYQYHVSCTEPTDNVLFSGNVLIQLGGAPERKVQGAIKIDIADSVSVYDRRTDRLTSFARAEHIQRTIGQNGRSRTFQFINLRDVSAGEVIECGGPDKVLSVNGLEEVSNG